MDNITSATHELLQFQLSLKIYHWQTHSYPKHIASDTLYSNISKNIDLIVETIQGEQNKRIKFTPHCVLELDNQTDKSIVSLLKDFKKWIDADFVKMFPSSKFLISIKDDIVSDINQTLYLFTLE